MNDTNKNCVKQITATFNRKAFSRSFINLALFSALSLSFTALSGCATTSNQNDGPILDLAKFATITTQAAVTTMESNYQSSDVNELSVYAPSHYSIAGKAIEDAKILLAQSQPRDVIVQKVAVADAILRNGDHVMHKVKTILKPEITVKEKLDSLNAKSTYSNEYGSLNERFNKLILEIESGNTKEDLNRENLLKDMHILERKAFYYNAMNEPREILKRVKYRGGEQLAPITYAEALAVFKRAEEFIAKNPNYDIGITQIGREALFAAKRALYITEGVATLKQRFEFAPEQIILDEEYRMYRVARQLAEVDYRDNSLEVQSELVAKRAADISLELVNKDGLVIALRDTLIKVRDSSSRLTMLSDSATQLKKEKNQWLAKEALFTAKVQQLEDKLKKTEDQLDFTQQTLLSFKSDNIRLTTQSVNVEQETAALKNELANIKREQQAVTPADQSLIADSPVTPLEKETDSSASRTLNTTSTQTITAEPEMAIAAEPAPIEPSLVKPSLVTALDKDAPVTPAPQPKANIAKTTIDKKPAIKQERAKITKQETFEAILSAKELIKALSTSDHTTKNTTTEKPKEPQQPLNFFGDDFSDDEDVFVDASE